MPNILWVDGRYHIGDDPGIFQNATYVGNAVELPFRKTWIDATAKNIRLFFYTTDVETWGNWSGHRVLVNGTEVGRLKDPSDTMGPMEVFEIPIARIRFESLLGGNDRFLLRVELETQSTQPGLSDDFLLVRIASDETIAAKLGGK